MDVASQDLMHLLFRLVDSVKRFKFCFDKQMLEYVLIRNSLKNGFKNNYRFSGAKQP
jgi:hypothetical protein